jgi:hypothetical protein
VPGPGVIAGAAARYDQRTVNLAGIASAREALAGGPLCDHVGRLVHVEDVRTGSVARCPGCLQWTMTSQTAGAGWRSLDSHRVRR